MKRVLAALLLVSSPLSLRGAIEVGDTVKPNIGASYPATTFEHNLGGWHSGTSTSGLPTYVMYPGMAFYDYVEDVLYVLGSNGVWTVFESGTEAVAASHLITWNGAVDASLSNPLNWTPNQVPTAYDDAVIDGVVIAGAGSETFVCANLVLANGAKIQAGAIIVSEDCSIEGFGASISVNYSGGITIRGNLSIVGDLANATAGLGDLTIGGDLTATGAGTSVSANSGAVVVAGVLTIDGSQSTLFSGTSSVVAQGGLTFAGGAIGFGSSGYTVSSPRVIWRSVTNASTYAATGVVEFHDSEYNTGTITAADVLMFGTSVNNGTITGNWHGFGAAVNNGTSAATNYYIGDFASSVHAVGDLETTSLPVMLTWDRGTNRFYGDVAAGALDTINAVTPDGLLDISLMLGGGSNTPSLAQVLAVGNSAGGLSVTNVLFLQGGSANSSGVVIGGTGSIQLGEFSVGTSEIQGFGGIQLGTFGGNAMIYGAGSVQFGGFQDVETSGTGSIQAGGGSGTMRIGSGTRGAMQLGEVGIIGLATNAASGSIQLLGGAAWMLVAETTPEAYGSILAGYGVASNSFSATFGNGNTSFRDGGVTANGFFLGDGSGNAVELVPVNTNSIVRSVVVNSVTNVPNADGEVSITVTGETATTPQFTNTYVGTVALAQQDADNPAYWSLGRVPQWPDIAYLVGDTDGDLITSGTIRAAKIYALGETDISGATLVADEIVLDDRSSQSGTGTMQGCAVTGAVVRLYGTYWVGTSTIDADRVILYGSSVLDSLSDTRATIEARETSVLDEGQATGDIYLFDTATWSEWYSVTGRVTAFDSTVIVGDPTLASDGFIMHGDSSDAAGVRLGVVTNLAHLLSTATAGAANPITWNGSVDADLSNPLNWTPNRVPTAYDDVVIGGGTAGDATQPLVCNNLVITNGASLNGDYVSIGGDLVIVDGNANAQYDLSIGGDCVVDGFNSYVSAQNNLTAAGDCIVVGDYSYVAALYAALSIGGSANISGAGAYAYASVVTVGGDLTITGAAATVQAANNITIGGNFALSGAGAFAQTGPGNILTIGGNFTIDGAGAYAALNYLDVSGDLTLTGDVAYVSSGGGSFGVSNNVSVLGAGAYLSLPSGDITINGDLALSGAGAYASVSTGTLNIGGDLTISGGLNGPSSPAYAYAGASVYVNGDLALSGEGAYARGNIGSVTIGGNATLSGEGANAQALVGMTIDGDTSLEGAGAYASVSVGTLNIGGDLTISGGLTGMLAPAYASASSGIDIGGNATLSGEGAYVNGGMSGLVAVSNTLTFANGSAAFDADNYTVTCPRIVWQNTTNAQTYTTSGVVEFYDSEYNTGTITTSDVLMFGTSVNNGDVAGNWHGFGAAVNNGTSAATNYYTGDFVSSVHAAGDLDTLSLPVMSTWDNGTNRFYGDVAAGAPDTINAVTPDGLLDISLMLGVGNAVTNGLTTETITLTRIGDDLSADLVAGGITSNFVDSALDSVYRAGTDPGWAAASNSVVYTDQTSVAIGSSVTAGAQSFAQGVNVTANDIGFAQGNNVTAGTYGFAQGENADAAAGYAFAQGYDVTAGVNAFSQGGGVTAGDASLAQGTGSTGGDRSLVQGSVNTAGDYSLVQGSGNTAGNRSFVVGTGNTAGDDEFIWGTNLPSRGPRTATFGVDAMWLGGVRVATTNDIVAGGSGDFNTAGTLVSTNTGTAGQVFYLSTAGATNEGYFADAPTGSGSGTLTNITAGTWLTGGGAGPDVPLAVDTNAVMVAVEGKGYLTSFTEADAAALAAVVVVSGRVDTVEGWGNHATNGYLTTDADTGATNITAGAADSYDYATRTLTWNTNAAAGVDGGATNIVAGTADSYNVATRTLTWNVNNATGSWSQFGHVVVTITNSMTPSLTVTNTLSLPSGLTTKFVSWAQADTSLMPFSKTLNARIYNGADVNEFRRQEYDTFVYEILQTTTNLVAGERELGTLNSIELSDDDLIRLENATNAVQAEYLRILSSMPSGQWMQSYNGAEEYIFALCVYDGKLYAGQGAGTGDGDVLVFDGTSWTTSYNGAQEQIFALCVYDGKLYAGQGAGTGDGDVLVFDGTSWTTSYNGAEEQISALCVYDGKLYAGQGAGTGDGDVLVFDGTSWTTSYNGAEEQIFALCVYDGKLYAGQGVGTGDGDVYSYFADGATTVTTPLLYSYPAASKLYRCNEVKGFNSTLDVKILYRNLSTTQNWDIVTSVEVVR